jgi:hypothetical protein
MNISIEADNRGLIVRTPYRAQFVSELKRLVPASERQFDGKSNSWIVDPAHGHTIQKLILSIYKEAVSLPMFANACKRLEREQVRVEYVGQCKQRADGSTSAYGHDGQSWTVILPESVLKSFFGQDVSISVEGDKNGSQGKPASLYAVLLIKPDANSAIVKSAYRRVARQWHTDTCKEPDAKERMIEINRAYEILSDPMLRRRYDAGLALEASLGKGKKPSENTWDYGRCFRTPLRCGLLTVDGERKLGRVIVSRIHDWRDIINDKGQTLVTSWPFGAETYEQRWV